MTFGQKILKARTTLNITQTELAQLTGISERSLYTYEQGNIIPRKSNLEKLAKALHVSVTYLLDDAEENTQKDMEKKDFIHKIKDTQGNKGAHEAQEILDHVSTFLAGDDLDDDAKEVFIQSLMEVYIDSKQEAARRRKKKTAQSLIDPTV